MYDHYSVLTFGLHDDLEHESSRFESVINEKYPFQIYDHYEWILNQHAVYKESSLNKFDLLQFEDIRDIREPNEVFFRSVNYYF